MASSSSSSSSAKFESLEDALEQRRKQREQQPGMKRGRNESSSDSSSSSRDYRQHQQPSSLSHHQELSTSREGGGKRRILDHHHHKRSNNNNGGKYSSSSSSSSSSARNSGGSYRYERSNNNNNNNNNNNSYSSSSSSSKDVAPTANFSSLDSLLEPSITPSAKIGETILDGQVVPSLLQTDPVHSLRMKQRLKQIDLGKNTSGYDVYISAVPKRQREERNGQLHPVTPDHTKDIPNRRWLGLVKAWRRKLHEWDPVDLATPTADAGVESSISGSAVSNGMEERAEEVAMMMEKRKENLLEDDELYSKVGEAVEEKALDDLDDDSDDDLL
jgi:hypothetical protein